MPGVRLKRSGLIASCFALFAPSTGAAGFDLPCRVIDGLMDRAHQNFTAQSGNADWMNALQPAGTDTCALANGEAGLRLYYCSWSFPYRTGEARRWFHQLDQKIGTCVNNQQQPKQDDPVNHPDSFILKSIQARGVEVSVSVKDKAALDRSLVFIRFQKTPKNSP